MKRRQSSKATEGRKLKREEATEEDNEELEVSVPRATASKKRKSETAIAEETTKPKKTQSKRAKVVFVEETDAHDAEEVKPKAAPKYRKTPAKPKRAHTEETDVDESAVKTPNTISGTPNKLLESPAAALISSASTPYSAAASNGKEKRVNSSQGNSSRKKSISTPSSAVNSSSRVSTNNNMRRETTPVVSKLFSSPKSSERVESSSSIEPFFDDRSSFGPPTSANIHVMVSAYIAVAGIAYVDKTAGFIAFILASVLGNGFMLMTGGSKM